MIRKLQVLEKKWNRDKFDWIVICIDWKLIKTKYDLYSIFKKYIKFPEYFAYNWDSFWDIITDEEFINTDIKMEIYNYNEMFTYQEDRDIFCRMLIDRLYTDLLDVSIFIYLIKIGN